MDGLRVSDANLVVYIHSSKASRVSQAILRELSSLLFKFSDVFDGVVLAYDVTIQSKSSKILPGINPDFGETKSKTVNFFSKPDMLFDEDIREEFNYKIKHGKEVFASTSHK